MGSLYLPSLPGSNNNFKRSKRFVRDKSRVSYKVSAKSIVYEALNNTKNLTQFLQHISESETLRNYTHSFKVSYASKLIVNKVLAGRDRWVQCVYFTMHRLNVLCKSIKAQIQLAAVDNKSEALLGRAYHLKGWEPFFPQYSYQDSYSEYPLKSAEKCPDAEDSNTVEDESLFNPCDESICNVATSEEMERLENLVNVCAALNKKTLRSMIRYLDQCPDLDRWPYLLVSAKRNHPEQCYNGDNDCSSAFVLLRKLVPHYENTRKVYSLLNELRNMHEMVADLDTALICGDISYIVKLCKYMPPEKPSKVFNVIRPQEDVNKERLLEKYGKHFTEYYKAIENLPDPNSCISCEKLITQGNSSVIKEKWSKLDNNAWSTLLVYLNSNQRIIMHGEHNIESLVGHVVCKSCSSQLNRNELPRVCVANGMDTGKSPACIADLSPLESMFIHLAMCYQTILKLSPMGAFIPYNARMASLKGFAVHIAAPVDANLNELKKDNSEIERRLSRSVNRVPGTAQYWRAVRRKIEAMMEKFGPPTWFVTFNPAEYNWDDLIRYLRENNKDLEGVDKLTD